jgi:hypothetical protein
MINVMDNRLSIVKTNGKSIRWLMKQFQASYPSPLHPTSASCLPQLRDDLRGWEHTHTHTQTDRLLDIDNYTAETLQQRLIIQIESINLYKKLVTTFPKSCYGAQNT